MLRLLCVCQNGMGTSTILKIKLMGISDKMGINATVESCSGGEAMIYASASRHNLYYARVGRHDYDTA